jgi:hypothetical protein
MTTTYWIILIIIAFINGFALAPLMQECKYEIWQKRALTAIVFGGFAFVFVLLDSVILSAKWVWKGISDSLQLKFYWQWYRGEYDNLPEDRVESIYRNAKMYVGQKKRDGKRLNWKYKHWLFCLNMIRKKYPREGLTWIDNPNNFIK